MNEDLEQLLSRQQLKEPSPLLDARVAGTLRGRVGKWPIIGTLATAALAACLALLAGPLRGPGFSSNGNRPGPPATAGELRGPAEGQFVRVDQIWSQVTPGDLVLTDDAQPVQPMRVQRLQHTRWIDESRNIRIEMTVPDDQVVLISAPIQ